MLRRLILLATLCAVSSAAAGRCLCPRRFRPVCGTDGKTYDSECNLTCATMKDMSLRLAYTGVCCPKPDCPPVKELICDNKGGTHDNECMFRYAFCVTRKLDGALLRIRKRGPCNVLPQTDRELCDLGCEGSLRDPICDTRGMTHQNLCWLSTAQCLARRDQRADTPLLAFKGPCPILPPAPPKDRLLPPSPPPTQLPEVRATEIRLGSKITQLVLPEDYFFEPTAEPELAAPEPNASAPEPKPKPSAPDLEYEYYSSEASAPEPEPLPELQPPHPEPEAKAEPESRPNYQTLSTPATGGPKVGAIELLPPEEGFPAEEELDDFPNLPPLEAAFGEDFLEQEPLDELPEYLSASSAVSELPIEIGTTPHPEPEPKAEISLPEPEPKPELSKPEPEPETYERAPAIREPLEDCSVASCSKAYEPLCDNRGHTHVNHCVYLYSQCLMRKKGEDVQIVFPGPCSKYRPTTTLPRPEPIARAEGKPEPEPQAVLFRRQPKPEPENKPEPEVEPEPESNPEPEIVPEPEMKPPVQPEPHPTFHRQPVLEPRLAPPSVLEPLIGSSSLGALPPTAPPAFRPQPTTQAPLPCPRCGPEDKSLFLICDNRNTTHQNLCRFNAASCASYLSSSAELIPVHFGPCDGFSATFEAAAERCPAACTLEFYPLCDGRNRTHSNLCAFQTASCELRKESGRGLVLAHLGECGSPLPVPVVDGGPPTPVTVPVEMDTEWWLESRSQPEEKERFDCPQPSCPSTKEPVCDSAGTTHQNVCLFAHRRCVAAAEGRVLTLAHEGECLPSDCAHLQNCSADFAPVCGTDFETYWNECVLRQHQCKEKEAGGATQLGALFIGDCTECLVRCSEEDSKAKVCDTLGDTHTRCRFRMASCIYGKKFGLQLSIAYQGDCCPSPDKCPPLEPTEVGQSFSGPANTKTRRFQPNPTGLANMIAVSPALLDIRSTQARSSPHFTSPLRRKRKQIA